MSAVAGAAGRPAVTPPPAEVVLEPIASESKPAVEQVRQPDREDREDS